MFRRALTLFGQGARTGSLLGGLLEAGLASGGLSLLGDLLAQHLTSPAGLKLHAIDWPRSVRIASFGFLLYGPYQYWWYGALARSFPTRSLPHFLSKVAANQLILGPIVVSAIFAWNLGLQGQLSNLPSKLSNDFATTVVNGWKFWVPAASVNFFAIPLQHQVWYMSACGLLWVTYLSYSATHKQSPLAPKTA